jgi:PAS domain-containing protein
MPNRVTEAIEHLIHVMPAQRVEPVVRRVLAGKEPERAEARVVPMVSVPDGARALEADKDGAVVYVDPRLEDLAGQSLRGWRWAKLLHPDDALSVSMLWGQSLCKQAPMAIAFRVLLHGEYRLIAVRMHPRLTEEGAVSGWAGCVEAPALESATTSDDHHHRKAKP